MKKTFAAMTALSLALSGCGGDDDAAVDMGMNMTTSPCRAKKSNAGQPEIELRLAALKITAPATLSGTIVSGLLKSALDGERFNWLIKVSSSTPGTVSITTGYGERDGTGFRFVNNAAPAPNPERWNPTTIEGATLSATGITAPAATMPITLPIFDPDPATDGGFLATPSIELPVQALELKMATLSENNSCVGASVAGTFFPANVPPAGVLQAFISVESAKAGRVKVGSMEPTLCELISGQMAAASTCDVAQAMWSVKPNALCTAGVCTETCDGNTTCNAWKLEGNFAAQGAEIN